MGITWISAQTGKKITFNSTGANSMTQPFDESDVLYRFKLTLEEIKRLGLLADECVVTENSLHLCTDQYWWEPAIEYQRQRVRDFIIARLLHEREALTAERDFYEIELWHVEDQSLDDWAISRARAALEQGAKLRGES